jgi:hypothetical protein
MSGRRWYLLLRRFATPFLRLIRHPGLVCLCRSDELTYNCRTCRVLQGHLSTSSSNTYLHANMLTKTTTRTLNSSVRVATFSKMAAARAQHTLPQLPYAYDVSGRRI